MKNKLFEDFDKRAQEVSSYFLLVKNLEQGSIKLSMGNDNKQKTKNIDAELTKTLKATGFLLLYNLIESTMRNAIQAIFDDIANQRVSYDDLRYEVKKVIIRNFKKKSYLLFERNFAEYRKIYIKTRIFEVKKIDSGYFIED
jgi:MAE_28990/MAE_18760-like HEPN